MLVVVCRVGLWHVVKHRSNSGIRFVEQYAANHPMTLAWLVLAGERDLDCLANHQEIQRDTAISMVMDVSQPVRRQARAVATLSATDPISAETCDWLLDHAVSPMVRREAVNSAVSTTGLLRRLAFDTSWLVRSKALDRLVAVGSGSVSLDSFRGAANDPHWRVRAALIHALEARDEEPSWSDTFCEQGVVAYLKWRRGSGESTVVPPTHEVYSRLGQLRTRSWWEDDPRMLLGNLRKFGVTEHLDDLPALVLHSHERVRGWALERLLEYGSASLCQEAAQQINDPRHPGWGDRSDFVRRLDPTRRPPAEENGPREATISSETVLAQLSPDHPVRRPARELQRETCWYALLHHGQPGVDARELIADVPAKPVAESAPSSISLAGDESAAPLRLAISGHYHLPSEHYAEAFDLGLHTFFWEPNYTSFNRFMGRLSCDDRGRIKIITGTFEAEPSRIEKDVAKAIRLLQVERLDTFLLFWVRSEARMGSEVRDCLRRLVESGQVNRIGFSTHQRSLAMKQMERPTWDSVMVRHNVAHRGAEDSIFSKAATMEQHLITFSSTCYGRLIKAGITARDCLRYSLRDPAVRLVLTAPSTPEQLRENCSALSAPELEAEEIKRLHEIGNRVYRENKAFESWIRSR